MRTGGELHKPRDFHLPVSHYRIGKHTGVSCSLCHRETRPVTKGANKPEGKAALDQGTKSVIHRSEEEASLPHGSSLLLF